MTQNDEEQKEPATKITEFDNENLVDNSFSGNNDENCFLHINETTQSKRKVRNKSTQVKARHYKCNDK